MARGEVANGDNYMLIPRIAQRVLLPKCGCSRIYHNDV